ncbi:MAG: M20/M25/M40 family metallo-hydrolase [Candidatus Delongbacteria bacterium]|nr:M20/M25/M40 family metallo-hydrolase [Candidatus Delongbacteria bacterium]MBN2833816.1 M20/M25/M40 family metallo-hydrolase [Candidatus Delongbacteria bacterium]
MSSVIQLLVDLIKINSINPFTSERNEDEWILGGNETEICNFLESKLNLYGFRVTRQYVHTDKRGKEYFNLLAEKGKGSKSILFYAHTDTVTANPWKDEKTALTPKFDKMEVYGELTDILIGLGANDMKAGIAIICEAVKDLDPDDYKIKVAFGVDEEFYSLGSNTLVNSDFMNDVMAIVVPEIGDGPNRFCGVSTLGIGRLGRCELKINIHGTGGHGAISYDPDFINAAHEASKLAIEIENLRLNYRDNFKFYENVVPDLDAVDNLNGSFYISRIDAGDGTLSIPSKAEMILDFTLTPNRTIEESKKMIEDLINKLYGDGTLRKVYIGGEFKKITVEYRDRPTPYSEAYLTGEKNCFTAYLRDIIDNHFGFYNYNMGYSVADENVFKKNFPQIPVIVSGPIGWNSHKENEWVSIKSVEELVILYRETAKNFGDYLKRVQSLSD